MTIDGSDMTSIFYIFDFIKIRLQRFPATYCTSITTSSLVSASSNILINNDEFKFIKEPIIFDLNQDEDVQQIKDRSSDSEENTDSDSNSEEENDEYYVNLNANDE